MVLKTARREERRIFNFIENSQGPGTSEGVQVAPRSVSRGSEEGSACIRFAMHPFEALKSVAVEVDAKIDPKNDQKMVPRWGQDGETHEKEHRPNKKEGGLPQRF